MEGLSRELAEELYSLLLRCFNLCQITDVLAKENQNKSLNLWKLRRSKCFMMGCSFRFSFMSTKTNLAGGFWHLAVVHKLSTVSKKLSGTSRYLRLWKQGKGGKKHEKQHRYGFGLHCNMFLERCYTYRMLPSKIGTAIISIELFKKRIH